MAFEFAYTVTLVLTHRELNVDYISRALSPLEASKAVSKGDVRKLKSGAQREATVTVWELRLHEEEEIDSEQIELSEFLRDALTALEPHSRFFKHFRETGFASLEVVWRTPTPHSSGILLPDVLATIGSIGLALDIEHYCNEA